MNSAGLSVCLRSVLGIGNKSHLLDGSILCLARVGRPGDPGACRGTAITDVRLSLVTDLITGLFIIVEDTISVCDWIDVDGHAGTVMDLTIRTVRLRDGQGAVHTIPFSQIKIVKNLSRDFANAVFEVRVPFTANLDEARRMISEVGADLSDDFRYRNEILAPVEVWGLERFEGNCIVVKGQIKTRPLQAMERGSRVQREAQAQNG
jgi:small conductance mechanosensitive channel